VFLKDVGIDDPERTYAQAGQGFQYQPSQTAATDDRHFTLK
jgi:hypothetical protein